MSAGGSFNPSGGPIDNQQRLQTSPNPSLPPADYNMGYAQNFQTPSFFNPFSGYSGANTGMGGFQSQFGGFQQPQFGGFGGFGGFQQPQYGGFQQPQYGGFQQPQYGGFQQQQFGGFGGGFQQPFDGGYGGGIQQPFSGGFGGQSNRFTRRGQEYTQPMPDYASQQRDATRYQQPLPPTVYYAGIPKPSQTQPGATPFGMGAFSPEAPPGYTPGPAVAATSGATQPSTGGNMGDSLFSSLASMRQPTTPPSTFDPNANETAEERRIRVNNMTFGGMSRNRMDASNIEQMQRAAQGYDMSGFGGFNPMMGGGIGAFGGRGFMGY